MPYQDNSDDEGVEEVGGVAGVVPVGLVVPPEVEPAVPALLGPIVLTAAQHPEEVMEAPCERVVAGLAVTQVPLCTGRLSQTVSSFVMTFLQPSQYKISTQFELSD